MSAEVTFGGGVEICDPPITPPPPQTCPAPGAQSPLSQVDPPGVSVPRRFGGLFISPGIKRDGRICVRLGLFASPRLPLPAYDAGPMEPLP